MWWRLISSDLLAEKRFTILFIVNLAIGLCGFVSLDSFKRSVESSLGQRSRVLLGADLSVSARYPISKEQRAVVDQVFPPKAGDETSEAVSLYSMVANEAGESRLIRISAIDEKFPFYGGLGLRDRGLVAASSEHDIHSEKNIWVYPEVLLQLKVKVGDSLKVGAEKFKITDVVDDDPGAGIGTTMSPKVFMGRSQVESTELLGKNSLAWYRVLYKKPGISDQQISKGIEEIFLDPLIPAEVNVKSHKNSSESAGRILSYLNDYLGLVSLVALFLSAVGASFLFRSYLRGRTRQIAILLSLGMTGRQVFSIYYLQISLLGLIASFIAFIASNALAPFILAITSGLVQDDVSFSINSTSLLVSVILGGLGSGLIGLPLMAQMRELKPATLFRQTRNFNLKTNFASHFASLFLLVLFWLLSVWQSSSWVVGSLFIGIFFSCIFFLGGGAYLLFRLIDKVHASWSVSFRLAMRNLVRQPVASISCFLALGLGVLLLNLVPQLERSLQTEIKSPTSSKLPSLFLFDIQEEQLNDLERVANDQGVAFSNISPMIRARLNTVNGQSFEKANEQGRAFTREEQREMRFRNRGFNLSYRGDLLPSERIDKGRPFSGSYSGEGLAEISLEKRFADRLKLKIGDHLVFDVQSIPVEGEVVNFRTVKWTSFQPNFFVQFQPGVLDMAPKTFLATAPSLDIDRIHQLQDALVEKLPNVSIVDVRRVVERLVDLTDQVSLALQLMAWFSLIVGFAVLYSIASHQARSRRWDINLMKVLGGSFQLIRKVFLLEFAILALFSGLLGVVASLGVSYLISSVLFDGVWAWEPLMPMASLVLLILVSIVIGHISVSRTLKQKPAFLLRSE